MSFAQTQKGFCGTHDPYVCPMQNHFLPFSKLVFYIPKPYLENWFMPIWKPFLLISKQIAADLKTGVYWSQNWFFSISKLALAESKTGFVCFHLACKQAHLFGYWEPGDARYTKSIYALLSRSIVWSLLYYCVRNRDHCCVLCDIARDLLLTWYIVHQLREPASKQVSLLAG